MKSCSPLFALPISLVWDSTPVAVASEGFRDVGRGIRLDDLGAIVGGLGYELYFAKAEVVRKRFHYMELLYRSRCRVAAA